MGRARRLYRAPALAALLAAGCSSDRDETGGQGGDAGPGPDDGIETAMHFVEATSEAGLDGFLQSTGAEEKQHIPETVGGGVAFFDFDQDGDLDAYFTNGNKLDGFPEGEAPRDALYRNDGSGRFTDVTDETGLGDTTWSNGVSVADYDNDGWPDVYISNFGANVLYHNEAAGSGRRFRDVTAEAGVGDPSWGTSACFFDYDGDGDLDFYLANYIEFDPDFVPSDPSLREYRGISVFAGPRGLVGAADRFYRNDGGGKFSDVTEEVGMAGADAYGFQAITFDHDGDGDLDIYVANDTTPNYLWRNNGNGTFTEAGFQSGVAYSEDGREQGGMGTCLGDPNGDGLLDIAVSNFSEDYVTLYRNDGRGFFTDISYQVHLGYETYSTLGWGCALEDLDNDGDDDLLVANGHVYPQIDQFDLGSTYNQLNQLFENRGGGDFREVTTAAGPGLQVKACSRGAAFGDYDNDGDVDVLFSNLDARPTLLRNDTVGGSWVKVLLVGTKSNRDAVGALVRVRVGEATRVRSAGVNASYLSANDPRMHFGLGAVDAVDAIEVTWPTGVTERFKSLEPNRLYTIEEGGGIVGTTAFP